MLVRQMGGAGAQGFRPSIMSMGSSAFRAAPPQIKIASAILAGAALVAKKATGVGVEDFVKVAMDHFQKPIV